MNTPSSQTLGGKIFGSKPRMVEDRLSVRDLRRKLINWIMQALLVLCAVIALYPLLSVFSYVFTRGWSGLNLKLLTDLPVPVGETGGGMGNAVAGTLLLVGLGSLVGIPWGIATGVYLAEYGRGKIASWLRFASDLTAGIPSIIIGLFGYALIVVPMKRYSAIAGGFALGLIMVPVVARITEELLRLVPQHIREAGLALGIPRWRVIISIVLKGSAGGISTGLMLAIARVAGETAPLLFTALGSPFWPNGIDKPIASIPVQIYTYAVSPFEDWHQKAWSGALLLLAMVFLLNLFTRLFLGRSRA